MAGVKITDNYSICAMRINLYLFLVPHHILIILTLILIHLPTYHEVGKIGAIETNLSKGIIDIHLPTYHEVGKIGARETNLTKVLLIHLPTYHKVRKIGARETNLFNFKSSRCIYGGRQLYQYNEDEF